MASSLKNLEKEVAQLPQPDLIKFRAWYEKFDSDKWDEQIEGDVSKGKLDSLAEIAVSEHLNGKSKEL
ncbi:MAG: hypothetical protein HQ521_11505 [Bacteroidetes bacterium]|nr:hypothetical protein [Bacteroidota bacterium]